jgi:putative cell wall-binding protein
VHTTRSGAIAGIVAVAAALASPVVVTPAQAAVSPGPTTGTLTVRTGDLHHADDESPGYDWYVLAYSQDGVDSRARVVVDDAEPVHHDGALRLSTPSTGDRVDIRYAVDSPVYGDDRPASELPTLADLRDASVAIKVTSGVAPTFVVEYRCDGRRSHFPRGDHSITYTPSVSADAVWHVVDLGDAGSSWSDTMNLDQLIGACPDSVLANYGFVLDEPGADARVDAVSVGALTTNFVVPVLERVAGADRRRTACALASRYFDSLAGLFDDLALPYGPDPSRPPREAATTVIVGDTRYADALAAGPLATALGGPLLLTDPERFATGCGAFTAQSGDTVYLVGGTAAVSPQVESTLSSWGYRPVRIAGADRYATAVAVAKVIDGLRDDGGSQDVFLASGTDVADALSAGAAAGAGRGAVLLTAGNRMAPATADYLAQHPSASVHAVGGPAASAADLPASQDVVGVDRYATAVEVAERFFPTPRAAAFASGTGFADALSGAAYGGTLGVPVVLLAPHSVPDVVSAWARSHRSSVRGSVLLGGTAAVDDATYDRLALTLTPDS